ncbi:hypothetical protein HK098_008297 [Nowakowskiella sp. JEL0407]|nr:hypothetical protein HK098_008297 [Nowakowskiella sp. JEL0407]
MADGKLFAPPSQKLSIYDEEDSKVVVDEPPTQLELAIRKTRHEISKSFSKTNNKIQKVVDEWITLEHRFKSTVSNYVDSSESLLPGAIYVSIAYFTGSILFKNRSLLTRIVTPPLFAAAAFGYMYPKTSQILIKQVPGAGDLHKVFKTDDLDQMRKDLMKKLGFGEK